MIRTPLAVIPYLVAVAAIVSGLLWHEADQLAIAGTKTSGAAQIGGPFRLIDQDGAVRTDKDFKGRYMLVYFGYTYCPDICPTTLGVIADAFDKLGTKKSELVPVFISVDPERDTPPVLNAYLKSFGPEFVGLTGSVSAVKAVAGEYHVYFAKHPLPGGGYSVDHSSFMYLMGPDGRFSALYDDASIGPNGLAADLRRRL